MTVEESNVQELKRRMAEDLDRQLRADFAADRQHQREVTREFWFFLPLAILYAVAVGVVVPWLAFR